jgi:LPS export ABC transporter permease LptG
LVWEEKGQHFSYFHCAQERFYNRMFRTSDRYISTLWIRYFGICLSLTLGILLLEDMYNHLHELLQQGLPLWKIGYYYLLLCPQLSPLAIPVAFFLSLLLTLGELRQHNEIIALQASGISLFVTTRSLAGIGILLSLSLAYFQWYPAQRTQQIFQEYQQQVAASSGYDSTEKIFYHIGWNDPQQHRLWYMRELRPLQGIATAVNLHERDSDGHETRCIAAAKASFEAETKRWTFYQGRTVIFDPQSHYPLSNIVFERYDLEDPWSSPQLWALYHKKPEELTLQELHTIFRYEQMAYEGNISSDKLKSQRIFYWARLFSPWSCLIIFLIALPCAAVGTQTDSMASIAKATGLLFIFYFLSHGCRALGLHGILSPPLAALCPYLLLLFCILPSYRRYI